MARKEIIWSLTAKNQFEKVLEFYVIRNGSSSYSLKILSEVNNLLKVLSRSEYIGRLTSNKTTRVIPIRTYLIFYEINKEQIEILSFWDNRQDENKIKFK